MYIGTYPPLSANFRVGGGRQAGTHVHPLPENKFAEREGGVRNTYPAPPLTY